MAQIQTSHRRVVLIHADWSTTQRVVNTARELDLFKGDKIWMLLDGMLDQRPDIFNPTGSNVNEQPMEQRIDLPNGMLALRHRKRPIDDPNMLDSIVKLTGKAALNSLRNELYWNTILSDQSSSNGSPLHKSHPSASSSPTSFSFSSSSFYSSSSSQSSNINNVPVTETPFSTLSSNPYPNGCGIVNYTDSDRKHRINILRQVLIYFILDIFLFELIYHLYMEHYHIIICFFCVCDCVHKLLLTTMVSNVSFHCQLSTCSYVVNCVFYLSV